MATYPLLSLSGVECGVRIPLTVVQQHLLLPASPPPCQAPCWGKHFPFSHFQTASLPGHSCHCAGCGPTLSRATKAFPPSASLLRLSLCPIIVPATPCPPSAWAELAPSVPNFEASTQQEMAEAVDGRRSPGRRLPPRGRGTHRLCTSVTLSHTAGEVLLSLRAL